MSITSARFKRQLNVDSDAGESSVASPRAELN